MQRVIASLRPESAAAILMCVLLGVTAPTALADSGELDQILRENALFFNILATFSLASGAADDAWDLDLKDINLNLLSRAVRDDRGRQFVRVRVAGAVRSNHNVELNLLDEQGRIVGKGFFGYYSGQLTFYDSADKAIIDGFLDEDGNFDLYDLRLPEGKQLLAWGRVDACFPCGDAPYTWYDGLGVQIGGGEIRSWENSDGVDMYWTFERGNLSDRAPAYGEAEYALARETTGAINSVLFDTSRTAASFFLNPNDLVSKPPGLAFLPRVTNDTAIVVTNPGERQIEVTYVARHYDGSVVAGSGIENPVTYTFSPGRQYSAYPGEIFRAEDADRSPGIFGPGEIGWLEVFSGQGDIHVMFLDGDAQGTSLDGNVGAEAGDEPIVFADLRLSDGASTGVSLLNLAHDPVEVRLDFLDRQGFTLRSEPEFYVAGYGIRTFDLTPGTDLMREVDPGQVAGLRVSCNNDNSIRSISCSELAGLATYKDRSGSLATAYAATPGSSGPVLIGPYFAAGGTDEVPWVTTVRLTKFDGTWGPVYLDLYDRLGRQIASLQEFLAVGGQATFVLDAAALPAQNGITTGYVRVRSDSGSVAGGLSLSWSDSLKSTSSTYPLTNIRSRDFHFNQVAQGLADGVDYWTGISLVNDLDKTVQIDLEVIRPDGIRDRAAQVTLQPRQQLVDLLSSLLEEPQYTRLDGYIRLTSSDAIAAVVFIGDAGSQFLSAVPGVPR